MEKRSISATLNLIESSGLDHSDDKGLGSFPCFVSYFPYFSQKTVQFGLSVLQIVQFIDFTVSRNLGVLWYL